MKYLTRFRRPLTILVLIVTFGVFILYIYKNPSVIQTVLHVNFFTAIVINAGYILNLLANAVVLVYSLRYIRKNIPLVDALAVTGYSSVVNFFGPLQSGPGFRAVYLKRVYDVGIKKYGVTVLIFYLFFGIINAGVVAIAWLWKSTNIWLMLLLLLCGMIAVATLLRSKKVTSLLSRIRFSNRNILMIFLGALLLVAAVFITYFAELSYVNSAIDYTQGIIYSSVANLSLFVSLTPGAIGFRESFLMFSQSLHGISTQDIISASIIDRAYNIFFLLIVFIAASGISNRHKLGLRNAKPAADQEQP